MKDTYRERIKEEQKKLSPSQVFFSEGYRKLFRDLANEVAGEKLEQLLLYQSTEDGLAGWNDGKRIGINIGNLITGSFLELEQKSDSLIGILGHECGHARFTDSVLRKVYVQNMLAGVWYPDAPEPENEDEEKDLNEMDTCLAGKNPVVVPLLTECASYISNLLNDVYIEEKMCSLFPGSIKKGILINRRRNVEWIPPLKELLEGNSDPVSVFLKVLVQYALRGYANSWNMESCEMLDTLNEVKQFVDLSVTADSDLIRYQATNQILLKMWKYFRNLLEELKQECKEPEENEEEPPQEEEPSEAEMRAIADPGGAVYKRTFPGKKTDAVVCVLVDNSGSMIGHRIEAAKVAALTLYDFCRKAGIPILVYGHHTDGYDHRDPSEETVYFHSYAEFEEDRNDRLRIITMENDGSNRDGAALLFMANKLLKRPEKQKLLFLISDGLPNATRYFGSYATADLKKIKEKLGKKGILFQAAAIGWDKEAIRKIYGNAYLDISSLEQLPIRLTKQLAKLLRRVN